MEKCCPTGHFYCSEQIAIPETFPNILKSYAKAAIRTQPYDLLRWSSVYFRCLANNAPPPEKIRLERVCQQKGLTKGYLKSLIAQVGKGFFISRCLLQERWKALCLEEDDLLKLLSLCRMVTWPQVHWLKVVAVMVGSLNETMNDTMVMLCELLTDDVEGGPCRLPYWMFKICYTFVAKLDCSQELCFVNGRLVLPWGDLEEPTPMEKVPKVLSTSLIKDTIIASCKAKFAMSKYVNKEISSLENESDEDLMMISNLGDPKEVFEKLEDFESIMLLLQENQDDSPTEDDFKGPHYVSEKLLEKAKRKKQKTIALRQQQAEDIAKSANELIHQEKLQMLNEIGPPWTLLHQFTEKAKNSASYNFIDQESIKSDELICDSTDETFDYIKEEPKAIEEIPKSLSSSSCKDTEGELDKKCSLESLRTLLQEGEKEKKFLTENTSSIISFLKHGESTIMLLSGEMYKPKFNVSEVITILEQAYANGIEFSDISEVMEHIRLSFKHLLEPSEEPKAERPSLPTNIFKEPTLSYASDDEFHPDDVEKEKVQYVISEGPSLLPSEFSPKKDIVSVSTATPELKPKPKESAAVPKSKELETKEPKEVKEVKDTKETKELKDLKEPRDPKEPEPPKEGITKVFENTVGLPPEQLSKMPKFCFDKKDQEEMVLGLIPLADQVEDDEVEEDLGSSLSESSHAPHPSGSEGGYKQDDEDLLKEEVKPRQRPPDEYYCCADAVTLKPKVKEELPEYRCSVKPMPGIGPAVSQATIDEFLSFLRVRSRGQRGLINPRNFKEEKCPYMVDTKFCIPKLD